MTEYSHPARRARTIGKVSVLGVLACLACLIPWFIAALGLTGFGLVIGLGGLGSLGLVGTIGTAVMLGRRSDRVQRSDPEAESSYDLQVSPRRHVAPEAVATADVSGPAGP